MAALLLFVSSLLFADPAPKPASKPASEAIPAAALALPGPEGKVVAQVEKAVGDEQPNPKPADEKKGDDPKSVKPDEPLGPLSPPPKHSVPQTPAETVKAVVDKTDSIVKWSSEHGITIGVIILVMLILLALMRRISRRIANLLTLPTSSVSSSEERKQRVNTLSGVIDYVGTVVIYVVAVLMIMDEINVPVAPLLAGAGVVGLAIAFGAQSLIKDFFYGFLILFEGQYSVNDEVEIGSVIGKVERLTLRVTVVRDYQGFLHYIPNGQVTIVCNRSQGWSRSVVAIGIGYSSDLDRAMAAMEEVGNELRADLVYGDRIIGDPEIWGVDDLGDSAVSLKMAIKVKPGELHTIRRQLLKRIKKKFDELEIEIPFPQQVVHLSPPEGEPRDSDRNRPEPKGRDQLL